MSKVKRPLAEAERIAGLVVTDLAPYCDRISVAGSVRRQKSEVGDLELVAIPARGAGGLFGDIATNLLWEHLHASDRYRFTKGDNPNGRYYQLALTAYPDLQVDLFLAEADNWGLTLLVRTGSAEFSARLRRVLRLQQALDLGGAGGEAGDGLQQGLGQARRDIHVGQFALQLAAPGRHGRADGVIVAALLEPEHKARWLVLGGQASGAEQDAQHGQADAIPGPRAQRAGSRPQAALAPPRAVQLDQVSADLRRQLDQLPGRGRRRGTAHRATGTPARAPGGSCRCHRSR